MIAAARLLLRNDPAKSQFLPPSGHGLNWLSTSQTRLPKSYLLRAAHASFPAHVPRCIPLPYRLRIFQRWGKASGSYEQELAAPVDLAEIIPCELENFYQCRDVLVVSTDTA